MPLYDPNGPVDGEAIERLRRMMQHGLDTPIIQGENFATVDLFDVDHARKVLLLFGQAFGRLPADSAQLSCEQRQFIESVAQGLASDGKVISVRLALFAEMIKGKPWGPSTLHEVGGTHGIGVDFLEETFGSRASNPKYRQHQQAARAVLAALLPRVGTDIKGHMQSHDELLAASPYQDRPEQFRDLIRVLDSELRLITPTDPDGETLAGRETPAAAGAGLPAQTQAFVTRRKVSNEYEPVRINDGDVILETLASIDGKLFRVVRYVMLSAPGGHSFLVAHECEGDPSLGVIELDYVDGDIVVAGGNANFPANQVVNFFHEHRVGPRPMELPFAPSAAPAPADEEMDEAIDDIQENLE